MCTQQTLSASATCTTPPIASHFREKEQTKIININSATALSRTPTDLIIDPDSRLSSKPPNDHRLTRQYAQYFELDNDLDHGSSPEGSQRALKKARVTQDRQTEDRVSSA